MLTLLAQVPQSSPEAAAESLASISSQAADSSRLYWEALWQELFRSGLWVGLERAAGLVAGLALLFWGASFMRGLIEEDSTPALAELFWPLAVIFGLLYNPAYGTSNLAAWVNATRTVPYTLVDLISQGAGQDLTALGGAGSLQQTILLAEYRVGMEQLVRNLFNQCAALPVGQFEACLRNNAPPVDNVLATVRSRMATAGVNSTDAFEIVANEIRQVFSGSLDPYTAATATRGLFARDTAIDTLLSVLLSWQKNTLPLFEYALMTSATLAPLCLGASLLPVGNRAIVTWVASFCGICNSYLCYYILLGLSAHNFAVNTGFSLDSAAFLMKTCLLDPALALLLGLGTVRGISGMGSRYLNSPFGYGFGFLRKHW